MSFGSEVYDEGVSETVNERILDHAHLYGLSEPRRP
jgi:hypothetical protein